MIPDGPVNIDSLADAVLQVRHIVADEGWPLPSDSRPRSSPATAPQGFHARTFSLTTTFRSSRRSARWFAELDSSLLAVQGPPGTGKTYTAGRLNVELLHQGKRVGVTANSHKVICNILSSAAQAVKASGRNARILKAGGEEEDMPSGVEHVGENNGVSWPSWGRVGCRSGQRPSGVCAT